MTIPLRCVVDASVSVKQFIPDPLTAKVNLLFAHLAYPQTEIFVPDLFYIECANVLWKYARAGSYDVSLIQGNLASLKAFPLRVVSTADLMADAVAIALNKLWNLCLRWLLCCAFTAGRCYFADSRR
ncbi:type II toxin-antitoxin system VapC family toxin [Nostoc sp.]|uniref:type II toxin-antitoxin system VapC family toxin n=1 Tax=Nostoc sp. TaxID=1180 RepID=UPI002FF4CC33